MSKIKSILFIITEDWYYLSHRRELTLFARNNGFRIYILTKVNNPKTFEIDKEINIIDWDFERSSKNLFKEIISLNKIRKLIKTIKPDIVHSVGLKPIIYSGLLSKFNKKISFLYAFAGLGSVFTNTNLKKYIIQKLILITIKFFFRLKKSYMVFQNYHDLNDFNNINYINIEKKIIQGSGIDPKIFVKRETKVRNKIQVLLPARLIYDKGIDDFIYLAKSIKAKQKYNVIFVIAGRIDKENPTAISSELINNYVKDGIIVWLNNVSDMKNVYENSDIICFPSFREGNPRALLEASCFELPIITYDVPGCNDIIKNNYTGILIPFRDRDMMQIELEKLIVNLNLRRSLGKKARIHVIENFSNSIIFNKYLKLWQKLSL